MKKLIVLAVCSLFVLSITAAESSKKAGVQTVKEMGPDYRVVERTTYETGPDGQAVPVTHSHTELATGMHYQNEAGQWVGSSERIELLPSGAGAAARHGRHKVIFPSDLYSGQIELQTPDHKWLRSQVLGLSYFDTASGQSVLITETKSSVGTLAAPNVVIYPEAFIGLAADVRYTYTLAGFEQDIILHQQPPAPEVYGLNPETTRLQVLTEFFAPPVPGKHVRHMKGTLDESLDFGVMKMGPGRAFSLTGAGRDNVRVVKQWQKLEGRDFLTEEVEFKQVESSLQALPLPPRASVRKSGLHRVVSGRVLPAQRLARQSTNTFQVARNDAGGRPGYVLDYSVVSSTSSFTFRGDTTYYVTNAVNIDSAVLEGGTVIKFARTNAAKITVNTLDCQTGPYRPAIFTAVDDDSVGDTITGISTGMPTNYYGGGLAFTGDLIKTKHLRVSYLDTFFTGSSTSSSDLNNCNDFFDIQAVNCRTVFGNGYTVFIPYQIRNGLFYQVQNVFENHDSDYILGYQVTVHRCDYFLAGIDGGNEIHLTNCLMVAVTNWDATGWNTYYTNAVEYVTDETGVFQTVGAGAHYLADSSPYRDNGTTNVSAQALAEIQAKTTYPPLLFSNALITVSTNLEPQATRDTDTPDLGYHYDPIDFVCSAVAVTNADLVVTNGAAIAYYNDSGILLQGNCSITSVGTPLTPNWIVHYAMVQEQPVTIGATAPGSVLAIFPGHGENAPDGFFRFSRFANPAGGGYHFYHFTGSSNYNDLTVQDCELWNGQNRFSGSTNSVAVLKNNLFHRSPFFAVGSSSYTNWLSLSNNLFVGLSGSAANNSFYVIQGTKSLWYAFDNAFDTCKFISSSIIKCTNGYNAYINCTNRISTSYGYGGDITLTNAMDWQSGPLGDFYQPANSPLLNAGSTDAFTAGLFHYTTLTNQVEETNSVVDIGLHYVATDANGNPLDPDRCCVVGPEDQWACTGDSPTFSVTALGSGSFTYVWMFGASVLTGETGSTLTITNATTNNIGTYSAVVSGPCSTATNSALLFVDGPPVITDQTYGPQCFTCTNTEYFDQSNIVLSVSANGPGLTYQWYRYDTPQSDGPFITGAHSNVITLKSVLEKFRAHQLGGPWKCVVTSSCGSSVTSSEVQVSMIPEITWQMETNRTVFNGDRFSMSFYLNTYGNYPDLVFQWQCSADGGVNFTNAAAATTSYWFWSAPLDLANNGIQYRCVLTDSCGSITSAPVVVTVTNAVAPDTNLVAWWRAESNALDDIGSNDGTPYNVSYTAGEVGQAFSLNGSNAYVFVPASSSLDVGQGDGFTIEAWVKLPNVSTNNPIVQWSDGTNLGVSFGVTAPYGGCGSGEFYADIVDTNGTSHLQCFNSEFVPENELAHVAITWDRNSGNVETFVNGDSAGAGWVEPFTPDTRYDLYLGHIPAVGGSNACFLNGALDEVSIYDRVLSSDEISTLYNAGSVGKYHVDLADDPQLSAPAPFMKAPFVVVGAAEAEQFDKGGEGVAYHSQVDYQGDDYRRTRASIEACDDMGLGYCLTKTLPGDWFNYTFQVRTAGLYTVEARVAAYDPSNTFRMEFYTNGVLSYQTADLTILSTNWECVADTQVLLAPGSNWMRLYMVTNNGPSDYVARLNYIAVYPTITMSPIPANTLTISGLIEGEIGTNLYVAFSNSVAAQLAVESISASDGGTLVFPEGTYYLAQNPLTNQPYLNWGAWNPTNWDGYSWQKYAVRLLTNNMRIVGDPAGTNTVLKAHNRSLLMFYCTDRTNITFENLTMEGAPHTRFILGTTNTVFEPGTYRRNDPFGSYLIFLAGVINANIHHCTFRNAGHQVVLGGVNHVLIQSNVFLNFTGEAPNGLGVGTASTNDGVTVSLTGYGPAVFGNARNYVVTGNYFNGSVSTPTNVVKADFTNRTDGILWFQSGGNGYLADNLVECYGLEAVQSFDAPNAVVRNQFSSFPFGGNCALAISGQDLTRSFSGSVDDMAHYFIGNAVNGSAVIRGNPENLQWYSLNLCGNVVNQGRLADLESCQWLNCAGNTVQQADYGMYIVSFNAYPEAEILKNDFRGVTQSTLKRPGGRGGMQNITMLKNQLGMGDNSTNAHVHLWQEDASAYFFIQNQYYDDAQNPTNLVTDPVGAPVHVW